MCAIGEQEQLSGLIRLKLAEDFTRQATIGPHSLGRPQPNQAGCRWHVRLPTTPDHSVSVAHQETVARF